MTELKAKPIICLIGFDCSGKTYIAKYLEQKHGFTYFSLSNEIREEAKVRGLDLKVQTLIDTGKDLREKYGNNILAKRVLAKLQSNTKYVIDSIRHPEEIEALMKKPKAFPVAVEASPYDRWTRFNNRKREEEKINLDDFIKRDSEAFYTKDSGQQIGLCMPYVKHIIVNIGTDEKTITDELHPKIEKLLQALERPTWDDYFFKIMDAAAERSTCDRGKSAAVIVKDKNVLATGYVGAPSGLKNCDEVGHLLEKRINADGTTSEHCIRTVHCEINAIGQAVKRGTSIEGSTIYMSMDPCRDCTKAIITSGIKEVKVRKKYHSGGLSVDWLNQAGIKITRLDDEVQIY